MLISKKNKDDALAIVRATVLVKLMVRVRHMKNGVL